MKILHISTGYPISFGGGITNYVRMLATEQSKAKLEVSVLGAEDNNKDSFNFKYYEYKSKKIRAFTLGKCSDKKSLNDIKKILEKEKFDLIHIHMMLDIDWDFVDLIKGKHKYIISLHDYYYICPKIIMMNNGRPCEKYDKSMCSTCITKIETYDNFRRIANKIATISGVELKYPKLKQNLTHDRYLKLKELLEGAELLLPVSNRVKEIYSSSGIEGKYKVMHIGNYTAENYKKFNVANYENKNTIDIVFIGALTYHKGAEILLELLKRVKNEKVKFHFYGRADEKYKEKLISNGLIFHGAYKQKDLGTILKKMDLGLVLSVWEDNAPQVVMELLNNNVPVIGTKMGGIPDFVNSSNGYLFNHRSKDGISNVINFIDNMTIENICILKGQINRTKTPNEHLNEIIRIYNEA